MVKKITSTLLVSVFVAVFVVLPPPPQPMHVPFCKQIFGMKLCSKIVIQTCNDLGPLAQATPICLKKPLPKQVIEF